MTFFSPLFVSSIFSVHVSNSQVSLSDVIPFLFLRISKHTFCVWLRVNVTNVIFIRSFWKKKSSKLIRFLLFFPALPMIRAVEARPKMEHVTPPLNAPPKAGPIRAHVPKDSESAVHVS